MGKIYSILTRPIRTFNIVNRTERILAKEKPTPAPQYSYVQRQKKMVDKLYPNIKEEHLKKNTQLDDRLKQVFVKSSDSQVKESKEVVLTKLLPQDRSHPPSFKYGVYEPVVIPQGKCSLQQALEFISKHNENPTENSIEKIAEQYKLDKQIVANILKHFTIPRVMDLSKKSLIASAQEKPTK